MVPARYRPGHVRRHVRRHVGALPSTAAAGPWTVPGRESAVNSAGWVADGRQGFLGGLFNRRPRLPDRSRLLWGETGTRFDKLDVLILVVLFVGLLTLRTFRLSDPYDFHFDEVYHARTAMEFLQGWRYGIPHDIYEFTHPHLAKYAMAEGIAYLGDNKVTATAQLGGSVSAVLVEPRWDDPGLPSDRAGDRFYVAGGDQVRVYDLQTRDLIATYAVTRRPVPRPRHHQPPRLRGYRQRRDRYDRHGRAARPAARRQPAAAAQRHDPADPRQRRGRGRACCG